MDTVTILRIVSLLCALFFFSIVFFAFKSGKITFDCEYGDSPEIKRSENPIGFYLLVLLPMSFGVLSVFALVLI